MALYQTYGRPRVAFGRLMSSSSDLTALYPEN